MSFTFHRRPVLTRQTVTTPRYPSLYQINTRVWLTELSRKLGRPAMLGWSPEIELKRSHWTKVQYTGSPASCIERITYSTAVKKKS
jgi:hypothetical protein